MELRISLKIATLWVVTRRVKNCKLKIFIIMYYYIYDSFLENLKYRKILDRVEIRLSDLAIAGEASHVRPLRNLEEIVLEALGQGKRTIIAVGNDYTFKKIVNTVLNQNGIPLSEITVGIIPVGQPNFISEGLGVPANEMACEVISGRIIKIIDVGQVNQEYFLTQAVCGFGGKNEDRNKRGNLSYLQALHYKPQDIIIKIDDKFQARLDLFHLVLINLSLKKEALPLTNPADGFLNVFATSKLSPFSLFDKLKLIEGEKYALLPKTSVFQATKVQILSPHQKQIDILGDLQKIGSTPATIKILPRHLRIIVGKERTFE